MDGPHEEAKVDMVRVSRGVIQPSIDVYLAALSVTARHHKFSPILSRGFSTQSITILPYRLSYFKITREVSFCCSRADINAEGLSLRRLSSLSGCPALTPRTRSPLDTLLTPSPHRRCARIYRRC